MPRVVCRGLTLQVVERVVIRPRILSGRSQTPEDVDFPHRRKTQNPFAGRPKSPSQVVPNPLRRSSQSLAGLPNPLRSVQIPSQSSQILAVVPIPLQGVQSSQSSKSPSRVCANPSSRQIHLQASIVCRRSSNPSQDVQIPSKVVQILSQCPKSPSQVPNPRGRPQSTSQSPNPRRSSQIPSSRPNPSQSSNPSQVRQIPIAGRPKSPSQVVPNPSRSSQSPRSVPIPSQVSNPFDVSQIRSQVVQIPCRSSNPHRRCQIPFAGRPNPLRSRPKSSQNPDPPPPEPPRIRECAQVECQPPVPASGASLRCQPPVPASGVTQDSSSANIVCTKLEDQVKPLLQDHHVRHARKVGLCVETEDSPRPRLRAHTTPKVSRQPKFPDENNNH
ncbi:pollen-specific leucine-rich repeat extensin-like protein 2 [Penaeus monodon]|uniref:pollen-specific leucine-rich repeat extensin-like protein 2 n=1 Tax=Penaeus monodon TaxID=6687 RepID=UPI0018A6E99B|nr:pollen-specific leucine-rich repeat extensin-like protein 2 [Penaeus monodon]